MNDNEYELKYNEVMGLLKATKMEHGLCKPVSRRACTACGAQRKLDKLLAEWPGPRIRLA